MRALIDGDILRYEIGYAAETGWKAMTEREEPPPFRYVAELLEGRISYILSNTTATEYTLYITEGPNFRNELAYTKPYKGQRVDKKPWHFDNLTAYMKGMLPCVVCDKGLEADDQMSIDCALLPERSIICSRDKDLRQCLGLFYSWELGRQASFGPVLVSNPGTLELVNPQKLTGTGYKFFAAQWLMGDPVDNIPGASGVGPVKTFSILEELKTCEQIEKAVLETYADMDLDNVEEQAKLLWIIRRLDHEGKPILWQKGVYE